MLASLDIWTEYILRFAHVVAGISWIGSSFYFIWLDSAFETPEKPRKNVDGEVFMVHGGFYYQVDKRKIYPGELPKTLHWFKWEATLTFITGFMLFGYMYLLSDASLLIDRNVMDLSSFGAIGLALGLIVASWFIYDFIYHPSIMTNKTVNNALALILSIALMYGVTKIFSGRGAFIIVGVIYGTCMLLNVWVRILPGQAKMLKDAEEGKIPDYALGQKSKARSVHNTYFIFPVLFFMLSNHYPSVYNHEYNWLLLMIIMVVGAMVRQAMITKSPKERFLVLPAAVGLLALVAITAHKPKLEVVESSNALTYSDVKTIIDTRCLSCHSTNNTDDVFKEAQKGVVLETQKQVYQHRVKMLSQVENKVMPLANKTGMKRKERAKLVQYLKELK